MSAVISASGPGPGASAEDGRVPPLDLDADRAAAGAAVIAASGGSAAHGPWLDALLAVGRHYRIEASVERVRVESEWFSKKESLDELVLHMARQVGLEALFDDFTPGIINPWRLPLIVDLGEGQVAVIETIDAQGQVSLRFSGDRGLLTMVSEDELARHAVRVLRVKPAASVSDARVDEYIKPYEKHWFWPLVLKEWPRYLDVMLASLVANVLTLASMLFSMQVYDRVIPSQSEPTLWVLFTGLLVALGFSYTIRVLRTHLSDSVGKRADLRVSDRVFGHALRLRNDVRPRSTGSFIAQIRELEQVREMVTSTTITAIADLPFFLLFLSVLWLISGSAMLVAVPVAAMVIILIPGLLVQKPLAKLSQAGMRESSIRSAMLVEAVQGMDDIKLLRAEARFQNQWNNSNEVVSQVSMRQRMITSMLMSWTQEVQTVVFATIVLLGAYKVMAGELTTGVLIASSMLASRMMMPLGQVTSIMSRWQQAKVARKGLDELMKKPVDQPPNSTRVHRPVIHGDYELSKIALKYERNAKQPALEVAGLKIRAGEKVALLGRNGAGKSTLLQLLAGLQRPQDGLITLDGLRMSVLDPADVRRDVSLLSQHSGLFFGSVRENLVLGRPSASVAEIVRALELSGAKAFVESLPDGLDYPIQEGGRGLSSGQRQTLLLARMLLCQPNIVLMDEPTACLDDVSERQLVEGLQAWMAPRTLVVATHRPAVLNWVDRVIVLDGGKVVLDGPKTAVLGQLTRPKVAGAPAVPASPVEAA